MTWLWLWLIFCDQILIIIRTRSLFWALFPWSLWQPLDGTAASSGTLTRISPETMTFMTRHIQYRHLALILRVQWIVDQSFRQWTPGTAVQLHLLVNLRSPLGTKAQNLHWININPTLHAVLASCTSVMKTTRSPLTNFIIQNTLPSASCCAAFPLGRAVEPQGCNAPGHKFNIQTTGWVCFWPA